MKKIVGGKLYDTDRALLIGETPLGNKVYRTSKGNFFGVAWWGEVYPIGRRLLQDKLDRGFLRTSLDYKSIFGKEPEGLRKYLEGK